MADERPLVEQILDVAVYAPIGIVLAAAEQVPALVGKGRSALEGQVTVARLLGRFTVSTARRKLDDTLAARWPSAPASSDQAAGDVADDDSLGDDDLLGADEGDDADRPSAGMYELAVDRPAPDERPDVESLAIPGYDSLAASQVVPRLDSLTADELAAVLAYERGTRRRRTIINRIGQLSGPSAR
jgi:hypothetical protein